MNFAKNLTYKLEMKRLQDIVNKSKRSALKYKAMIFFIQVKIAFLSDIHDLKHDLNILKIGFLETFNNIKRHFR